MDKEMSISISQGSDYSYSDSYTSELSGYGSSRGGSSARLQGTLAKKRSSRSRDASVVQYITPKQNGSKHNGSSYGDKSEQHDKERKVILQQTKSKPEHDKYFTHRGNYEYSENESSDTQKNKYVKTGRNGSDRTSQYSGTLLSDKYSGTLLSDKYSGTLVSGRSRQRYGSGRSPNTDSEDESSESTDSDDFDGSSYHGNHRVDFRRKSDRVSVSFSEDTEIPRPKSMQSFQSHGSKGLYHQEPKRRNNKSDTGILRNRNLGLKLPDDPYSVPVGVKPFQMSIPRTPSPPPVKVTPKLKTKTVKCMFEEPPILKYKTAIIDIGERVKREEPDEIVVVQTDPPECEDIPPSPIGECVLRYHIPPSPEPEPVVEPIPPPPPPPYKPPKIKNNPIVIRVGGGWMQVDHHRKNHIPLIVYDRQRSSGSDKYLYIKSRYTTNRNVEPISYRNKTHLLQTLKRESAVVSF